MNYDWSSWTVIAVCLFVNTTTSNAKGSRWTGSNELKRRMGSMLNNPLKWFDPVKQVTWVRRDYFTHGGHVAVCLHEDSGNKCYMINQQKNGWMWTEKKHPNNPLKTLAQKVLLSCYTIQSRVHTQQVKCPSHVTMHNIKHLLTLSSQCCQEEKIGKIQKPRCWDRDNRKNAARKIIVVRI